MRLVASKAGVTGWLTRRECGGARRCPGGTPPPPFACVPPRLRVPIESIAEERLLKVILLGFSRDGDHLLCYSSAAGRYRLHVWCFRGRAPATPLVSVPLFAELREHASQPHGRELGGLFDDDDRVAPLRITMCETADGALLVIHGCECRAEGSDGLAEAEDSPLWRESHAPHIPASAALADDADAAPQRNFVTVVPAPWRVPAAAAPLLHATHFRRERFAPCPRAEPQLQEPALTAAFALGRSYESVTPHPPFQPALCIVAGPPGAAPALVLPTGEGLLAVQLSDAADACVAPAVAPDGVCDTRAQWADDEDAAEGPPVPPPAPAADADAGNEPGTPPAAPRPRVRLRARIAARFDAEVYISHVLSGALAAGARLVDYTVQLVVTQRADAAPHPLAVVMLLALLRPRGDDESASSGGGAAPPLRLVQLVCAVACGGDASVRLLLSRELRPMSQGAPIGALTAMGARLARALRQRGVAPVPSAATLPIAMSNAGVLASWRSADAIRHPWLPLCITGFGITLATDDED